MGNNCGTRRRDIYDIFRKYMWSIPIKRCVVWAICAPQIFVVLSLEFSQALGFPEWNFTAALPHLANDYCTINRVESEKLTPSAFHQYFWQQQPVILTGLSNSEFANLTTKARLLADYGHLTVTLSTANTFSHVKIHQKLRCPRGHHSHASHVAASEHVWLTAAAGLTFIIILFAYLY